MNDINAWARLSEQATTPKLPLTVIHELSARVMPLSFIDSKTSAGETKERIKLGNKLVHVVNSLLTSLFVTFTSS